MSTAIDRDYVLSLMKEKERIEEEIQAYSEVLKSQNVSLTESLIDKDDFPRNDIDIYQVREARNKIRRLQTDLKAVMVKIEDGLHEIHSKARTEGMCGSIDTSETSLVENGESEAFAVVRDVSKGSPADAAGLKDGDLILEFGSINCDNFIALNQIARIVKDCEGASIPITLFRTSTIRKLTLCPKKWNGKGILGCFIKTFTPHLDR